MTYKYNILKILMKLKNWSLIYNKIINKKLKL